MRFEKSEILRKEVMALCGLRAIVSSGPPIVLGDDGAYYAILGNAVLITADEEIDIRKGLGMFVKTINEAGMDA